MPEAPQFHADFRMPLAQSALVDTLFSAVSSLSTIFSMSELSRANFAACEHQIVKPVGMIVDINIEPAAMLVAS